MPSLHRRRKRQTRPGQIRRPDDGVDRGSPDPNGTTAALPTAVFEVLSPSTRDFDSFRKLEEYKGVASMEYMVEPNSAFAAFWSRDDNGQWREQPMRGLAEAIEMPKLKIALPMAGIYEGVEFPALPRLVASDEESGSIR